MANYEDIETEPKNKERVRDYEKLRKDWYLKQRERQAREAEPPPLAARPTAPLPVGIKTLAQLKRNECHFVAANGLYCAQPVASRRTQYCPTCHALMHTYAPRSGSIRPFVGLQYLSSKFLVPD